MSETTKTPGFFSRCYTRVRNFVTGVIDHYRHYERPRSVLGTVAEFFHISVLLVARLVVFTVQKAYAGVKYLYNKVVGLFSKTETPAVATANA